MKKAGAGLIGLCLLAVCGIGAAAPAPMPGESPVRVVVSVLPQQYLLNRVGGARVQVEALVRPGQSPETFEPTARQMAVVSASVVCFRAGFAFEDVLVRKLQALHPSLIVVDCFEKVRTRASDCSVAHAAEAEADHGPESELDPHTWTSPLNMLSAAGVVCDTLCSLDPGHADGYRRNLQAFSADLTALHAEIAEMMRPVQGRSFLVFHPAWGYFADAYGVRQKAIETEGKSPNGRDLAAILRGAREARYPVVFVEPQSDQKSARAVAQSLGAEVVSIDALAADYPENLRRVARLIRDALERKGADRSVEP